MLLLSLETTCDETAAAVGSAVAANQSSPLDLSIAARQALQAGDTATAIAGYSDVPDRVQTETSGLQAQLEKPLAQESLVNAVARTLSRSS